MTVGLSNIIGKTITKMTMPDAKAPVVLLEAAVIGGRSRQAYKRGGVEETRERVIEETTGSIVWLWGVKAFNKIGDKLIAKSLGIDSKHANFDVGQDQLRKPFNNFINNKLLNPKNLTEKKISMLKFGKVAASVLAANYIIGFIVPPVNHKLTNYFSKKDKNHVVPVPHVYLGDTPPKSKFDDFKDKVTHKDDKDSQGNVQFKGGLNAFTNYIENTNTGQLLSTDLGVLGGRTYNARKKQEKIEIAVRDGGSIYFYMWSQDHTRALLNKIESGRWTRLDPSTVDIMHSHMAGMFSEPNSTMTVEEFRQAMKGKESTSTIDLSKFFNEKQEAITLDHFKSVETNPEIQARALKMSELQPKQLGMSVLSREQVKGIYQQGEINNPKLLKTAFENYTEGASSDPYKYVKNSKLEKLKGRMIDYIDDICKAGEKNGNKVDLKLLNKMKKKNMTFNGINFAVGFSVAALFLSTLIPKFQYWITKKMTGVNAFPGTYEYEKQCENKSQKNANSKNQQVKA